MYRKILLAYDGTTFCTGALAQATELARLCQAELHLLSVVTIGGGMAIAEAVGTEDVMGQAQQDLERSDAAIAEPLRRQGMTVVTCVRYGQPAAEIAAYAHEIEADLVVLGYSGKGLLARWFQGSVGSKLMDHLPCSLLVATSSRHQGTEPSPGKA